MEKPFEEVLVGQRVVLRYETVKFGVKTHDDTIAFDDGGFLAMIDPSTVRVFEVRE